MIPLLVNESFPALRQTRRTESQGNPGNGTSLSREAAGCYNQRHTPGTASGAERRIAAGIAKISNNYRYMNEGTGNG